VIRRHEELLKSAAWSPFAVIMRTPEADRELAPVSTRVNAS
jgi:hypothetical protein